MTTFCHIFLLTEIATQSVSNKFIFGEDKGRLEGKRDLSYRGRGRRRGVGVSGFGREWWRKKEKKR